MKRSMQQTKSQPDTIECPGCHHISASLIGWLGKRMVLRCRHCGVRFFRTEAAANVQFI